MNANGSSGESLSLAFFSPYDGGNAHVSEERAGAYPKRHVRRLDLADKKRFPHRH